MIDNINDEIWDKFLDSVNYDEFLNNSDSGNSKDGRARIWTFLVFPEFAKSNWVDLLQGLHLECAISPLHHGYKEDSGPERKDHYHVMVIFNGKKSQEQVQAISDLTHIINKGVKPFRVNSDRGLLRYFLHLDNPEKEQFPEDIEILFLGGFRPDPTIFEPASMDLNCAIAQMQDFVVKNNISEIASLYDYARNFKRNTWFYYLNTRCYNSMSGYIKSRRHGNYIYDKQYTEDGRVIDYHDFKEF